MHTAASPTPHCVWVVLPPWDAGRGAMMTMILFLTRGGRHLALQCLWGLVLLGMYGTEYNNPQAMCPEPQQLTKQVSATKTHFSCETLLQSGTGRVVVCQSCAGSPGAAWLGIQTLLFQEISTRWHKVTPSATEHAPPQHSGVGDARTMGTASSFRSAPQPLPQRHVQPCESSRCEKYHGCEELQGSWAERGR